MHPTEPWHLTDLEWHELGPILGAPQVGGRGRPPADTRAAAEACLYHHFQSLAPRYRTFGWNQLPATFGVSPSTANRRYRAWEQSGAWPRFFRDLQLSRLRKRTKRERRRPPQKIRVSTALAELERAFSFFNAEFMGDELPDATVLVVDDDVASISHCAGYFRPAGTFRHLIAIGMRTVAMGPGVAIATLLHEMAHLRCWQLELPATRSDYHNSHFRDTARLFGLETTERAAAHGYAGTRLSPTGERALAKLAPDPRAFLAIRAAMNQGPTRSRTSTIE